MPHQDMEFEYSQRNGYHPPYAHSQDGPPFYAGQKIPLARTSLVPPLSQRLLVGLVSAIIWVLLIGFGLISYLGDQGTPNLRLFLFLIILAFTACLVGINIIFCCVGLLLTRNHNTPL